MSYAKFRDMVQLCGHLQARSMGLTITELMQLTERSRKTVERMLGTLIGLGLVEANHIRDSDHHLTKRWRLEGSADAPIHLFMNIEPLEKVALERLLNSLDGGPAQRGLTKMLSVQKPLSRHLVNDLDEFIERDAHIGRVGPKSHVRNAIMQVLEPAVVGSEQVRLRYKSELKRRASARIINPHGFLFGRFSYLVASTTKGELRIYRLDLIEDAEALGTYFEEPKTWSFKQWVQESFGVFHGDEKLQVKILFAPTVAKRAESIQFHSSQTSKRQKDGSLLVTLTCKGHRELIHELLHPDWLGNFQILEPKTLVDELRSYMHATLESHQNY